MCSAPQAGHRWEVVPPRFALLTAAAALGLGVPLFLAAAAYFAWQAAGGRDPVQSAVSAVVLLAAAAGCGRGAWYFYLKLRAAPAAGGPPE